jgi:hypothetical protein
MEDVEDAISDSTKKTEGFFKYVFKMGDYEQSFLLNIVQYTVMAILPVIIVLYVNHYYIPEIDEEKGSIVILAEMFGQLFFILFSFYFINRIISYFPTYSGFKYENLMLTNVILAFLIIVLSIQTKLGLKANILVDRVSELWNGTSATDKKANVKKGLRVNNAVSQHSASQADYLDNSHVQSNVFPPAPVATSRPSNPMEGYDNMMGRGGAAPEFGMGPAAANSLLGSSFGAY